MLTADLGAPLTKASASQVLRTHSTPSKSRQTSTANTTFSDTDLKFVSPISVDSSVTQDHSMVSISHREDGLDDGAFDISDNSLLTTPAPVPAAIKISTTHTPLSPSVSPVPGAAAAALASARSVVDTLDMTSSARKSVSSKPRRSAARDTTVETLNIDDAGPHEDGLLSALLTPITPVRSAPLLFDAGMTRPRSVSRRNVDSPMSTPSPRSPMLQATNDRRRAPQLTAVVTSMPSLPPITAGPVTTTSVTSMRSAKLSDEVLLPMSTRSTKSPATTLGISAMSEESHDNSWATRPSQPSSLRNARDMMEYSRSLDVDTDAQGSTSPGVATGSTAAPATNAMASHDPTARTAGPSLSSSHSQGSTPSDSGSFVFDGGATGHRKMERAPLSLSALESALPAHSDTTCSTPTESEQATPVASQELFKDAPKFPLRVLYAAGETFKVISSCAQHKRVLLSLSFSSLSLSLFLCLLHDTSQDKSRCYIWRQVVHQLTSDVSHCFLVDSYVAVAKLIRIIRLKQLFLDETEPRNMQFVRWYRVTSIVLRSASWSSLLSPSLSPSLDAAPCLYRRHQCCYGCWRCTVCACH
jgi:hypothetical protein